MKKIVSGVMILTISSFIIKILGFIFRIYLTNIIGAEGAGLYQLILSVYAMAASFAVSGISTAVSALVGGNPRTSSSVVKTAVIISAVTGFITFALCFFETEFICSLIGDPRALKPLKIISFCFPFTSLFAALSGYFNGKCDVAYPIGGQIIEQLVRIGLIFLFVAPAAEKGIVNACIVTAAGITVAEAVSAIYLAFMYYLKRPYQASASLCPDKIFSISLPSALNGWAGSLLHTAESIVIPSFFAVAGFTHSEAISALGIIKGMVMPIILLPNIFITALSTVILPSVSYAREHNRMFKIKNSVSALIKFCFVGGVLASVIFFCFGKEICMLIYHNTESGQFIGILGLISPFLYVNILSGSILCGLGKQKMSLYTGLTEGISRIILMAFLIPKYQMYGCAAAMIAGSAIACNLNILIIYANIGEFKEIVPAVVIPVIAGVVSCVSYNFFNGIFKIAGTLSLYFLILIIFHIISIKDFKKIKRNVF